MKTINELTVEVKYTVSLNNISVSDIAYDQLMSNNSFNMEDYENEEAFDWLLAKIHEDDAMDWNVSIIEIN